MNPRHTIPPWSLALLLALPSPGLRAQAEDTIRLRDGRLQSAQIQGEDYDRITIQIGGATSSLPWKSVQAIQYAGGDDLTRALEALRDGSLDEARRLLEELRDRPRLRPVLRQQALFHLALLAQRQGRFDEAIAGYQAVLKEFRKSRYLRSLGENLVACHLAKKDPEGAGKALEHFLADAKAAGVEGGFQAELGLLMGRVLEAQRRFAEARGAYEAAQKASAAPATVLQEARLGFARSLHGEGKAQEAEPLYRRLVAEDAPPQVLAGAWNGIGDLSLEEGKRRSDAERITEALLAYLRGVVLYVPAEGEPTAEYERALAGSALCFKFIADLESKADRKRLYLERARERREFLRTKFPSSPHLEGLD